MGGIKIHEHSSAHGTDLRFSSFLLQLPRPLENLLMKVRGLLQQRGWGCCSCREIEIMENTHPSHIKQKLLPFEQMMLVN